MKLCLQAFLIVEVGDVHATEQPREEPGTQVVCRFHDIFKQVAPPPVVRARRRLGKPWAYVLAQSKTGKRRVQWSPLAAGVAALLVMIRLEKSGLVQRTIQLAHHFGREGIDLVEMRRMTIIRAG